MKLYWGSGSPLSWRVQVALALKGTPFQSHRLDLGTREHRGDAYRAINPLGTFPVLVDGEVTVRESLAILAYLERVQPAPPLLGATAAEGAAIWQFVLEHQAGLAKDVAAVTQTLFRDRPIEDVDALRAAGRAAEAGLSAMNDALDGGGWLIGTTPSAAEATAYPTIQRFVRACAKPAAAEAQLVSAPLAGRYPALGAWLTRLEALPGVDDTYPPHWRDEKR